MTIQYTPKYALPYPQGGDTADVPRDVSGLALAVEAAVAALGTVGAWQTIPPGAAFNQGAAGTEMKCAKDGIGRIFLRGTFTTKTSNNGLIASLTNIGVLPTGYWPTDVDASNSIGCLICLDAQPSPSPRAFAGQVATDGSATVIGDNNWTSSKTGTGTYVITYLPTLTESSIQWMAPVVTPLTSGIIANVTTNAIGQFTVQTKNLSNALTDASFFFQARSRVQSPFYQARIDNSGNIFTKGEWYVMPTAAQLFTLDFARIFRGA